MMKRVIMLGLTGLLHQGGMHALVLHALLHTLAQHGGIVGKHGLHIHTRATRRRVSGGHKHHPSQLQAVMAQGIERQQNMVEAAQIIAAHKQHGQAHRCHKVKHVFTLVERHTQPASALKQQQFCVARLPVAFNIGMQMRAAQTYSITRCGQMRRCGQ